MKALVTGASSGIGLEIAKYLSDLGYDLILVARRMDRLEKLKKVLKTNVKIIPLNLGEYNNLEKLYDSVRKEDIDILVNNAGFGLFGEFDKTDLDREMEMIDLNVKAVHYAVDQMFKHKLVVIPTLKMKLAIFGTRFVSTKLLLKLTYNIQDKKMRNYK